MIWKRNPGKKREKKELLRALFERYWRRSPNRIPPESDIHRNLEHPTNRPFTQQHTLLTHSLINKTRGWSRRLRDYRLKLRLGFLSKDYKLWLFLRAKLCFPNLSSHFAGATAFLKRYYVLFKPSWTYDHHPSNYFSSSLSKLSIRLRPWLHRLARPTSSFCWWKYSLFV